VGRHDERDEDEMANRDGYVGWIPREAEPGQHAVDDPEEPEEEE